MNVRAIATLGIGFGALAIATLGFLSSDVQEPAVTQGGGGGKIPKIHQPVYYNKQHEITLAFETEDEETAVLFVITELIKRDLI